MMSSILKLVILVFNLKQGCHQVVSLEKDRLVLPNIDIVANLNIDEAILHKLSRYIDLPGFPSYKITDITVRDTLDIYYFCFINHDVKTKNIHLLELDKYNENTPNIKKIIMGL